MTKNKNVIDLLYVVGWVCFCFDAFLLVMLVFSGRFYLDGWIYFIYAFILGCFTFMTRSLMEMAEAQKSATRSSWRLRNDSINMIDLTDVRTTSVFLKF